MMEIIWAKRARRWLTKAPGGAKIRYMIELKDYPEGGSPWRWTIVDEAFEGYSSERPYPKASQIWAAMVALRAELGIDDGGYRSETLQVVTWHPEARQYLPQ